MYKFIKYSAVILIISLVSLSAQTKVALISNDTQDLSEREEAVSNLLIQLGYEVQAISYSNATYNNLSNYLFTVATDNGAISSDVVNSLIENEEKVVLLYDAGQTIGGTWSYEDNYDYQEMIVENGSGFLEGYESNVPFLAQTDEYPYEDAFYIKSGYPYQWTILARNDEDETYKTALMRESSSGGKGVIWTYDPINYTGASQNLLALITDWFLQSVPWDGITIENGKVALIIQGLDDSTPTLTERENSINEQLSTLGYEVTFVRFSRISKSNFNNAEFVISTEYPTINANDINNLIEGGQKVALLYSSAAGVGGTWSYEDNYDYQEMIVENGSGFLEGYESNVPFLAQTDEYPHEDAFYIESNYPNNWTILARNDEDETYKTALMRESSSRGKGVIWTYDPVAFSSSGKNLFIILLNRMSELPLDEIIIEDENIAFVIENDFNIFTESESALIDKLESMGYELSFIPFGKLSKSDVSDSKFIITTEYPTISRVQIDSLMNEGEKIILLNGSGAVTGGNWFKEGYNDYNNLYVEKSESFLTDYSVGSEFEVQSNYDSYYLESNYPIDWNIIGRNTSESNYKTALFKISLGSGKGTIFSYDPEHFTDMGDQILEKQINWLQTPPPVLSITGDMSHTFDSTRVGTNPQDNDYTFTVSNNGGDVLEGEITSTALWLSFSPSTFNLEPTESQVITVTATTEGLNEGTYVDTVTLSTNAGSQTGIVEIELYEVFPPQIAEFSIQEASDYQHLIDHQPIFLWDYNDPEGRPQESYQLQISTNSNFSNIDIWNSGIIEDDETSVQYTGEDLIDGETYYVRLKVTNSDDISSDYNNLSFHMNEPPTTPTPITPSDNQEVNNKNPKLTVENSIDQENDPITYKFYLSDDSQMSNVIDSSIFVDQTSDSTSWETNLQLEDDKQYWWRAIAFDGFEYSNYSNTFSFTVNIITSVQDNEGIPEEFSLSQNYPNPFNPNTIIKYGLPKSTNVKLSIYNVNGELVKELVNGHKQPGWYEIKWNGINNAGTKVSSGLYILRIDAGNFTKSRKMIMLK